jgi:lipopolysaccharide transport system ATP-binding protein
MNDAVIRVGDLGKQYRIGKRENYPTLRDALAKTFVNPLKSARSILSRKQPSGEGRAAQNLIWALKDVSFEVERGEVLGIIGPNGAGKSTLLKILSQITAPTLGYIEIHGRMASLLEVGTGFHPELTGAENIYLNGAILGMKGVEIKRRFDEIVSFAEVEQFIYTPVKHYSSGMYLRLAFAVAAHLEPEILVVDEVLAVGDAAFQKKCLGKMGEVATSGRTVLFVSHNMAAVQQLTQRSLLLEHGQLVCQGATPDVIHQYLDGSSGHHTNVYSVENAPRYYPELRREVEFLELELKGYENQLLPADSDLCLRFTVRGNETIDRFRFSLTIFQIDGLPVGNVFGPEIHTIQKGEVGTFVMDLTDLRLARGRYYCAIAIGKGNHLEDRVEFDILLNVLYFEVMGPLRADGVMSEWFSVWGPIRFKEPKVVRES